MSKLIDNPHLIFLISIPIILLVGVLGGDHTIDLNVHDTYFVISNFHLALLISVVFGLISIGYWLIIKLRGQLSSWLSLVHIILTVGGFIILWIGNIIFSQSILDSAIPSIDGIRTQNLIIAVLLIVIIIGQLVYPINLLIGLIRRKEKTSG